MPSVNKAQLFLFARLLTYFGHKTKRKNQKSVHVPEVELGATTIKDVLMLGIILVLEAVFDKNKQKSSNIIEFPH